MLIILRDSLFRSALSTHLCWCRNARSMTAMKTKPISIGFCCGAVAKNRQRSSPGSVHCAILWHACMWLCCRKGRGVLFFPALPDGSKNEKAGHGSCAVTEGTKYAAQQWFLYDEDLHSFELAPKVQKGRYEPREEL